MKILFRNAVLLPQCNSGPGAGSAAGARFYVVVDGRFFTHVGQEPSGGTYDRIVDCRGRLLMPAFYNTHCHAAMTLFRGYADDLPLSRWLGEKILPEGKKIAGPRTPYRQSIRIFYRFIGEVSGDNLREMQANRDREEAAHAAGM